MRPVRTFQVQPAIPERLRGLVELAYNLRWSWDHETIGLFRRIDRNLWEETYHDPVLMLGTAPQERLEELVRDQAFLSHLDRIAENLDEYIKDESWYSRTYGRPDKPLVAYFSMEFGLTECLPIYSGGLGILAGDHLKSASDLGLPLVGVGLLYQKGYFHQTLTPEGWQEERYEVNDFATMPVRPFLDDSGQPVVVSVDLAGRPVMAKLWRVAVGRVTLVLLDTHLTENPPDLREVTAQLYGGDSERRIQQEIVLGIGGLRALDALGLRSDVYHMNEGHSAFLALELTRLLMKAHDLSFDEAREITSAGVIFTTHTPVPAGIDVFSSEQIKRYFGAYCGEVGIDQEVLMNLGRSRPGDKDEQFNTAVFAIRSSGKVNGVSRLHAQVSRSMWHHVWPNVPVEELPITHVTNGIHPESWISKDMRKLYDDYLGPRWAEEPGDTEVWSRSDSIPPEELWNTHEHRREKLVNFARRRLREQMVRRGAGPSELAEIDEILDPHAMTIGFARRFATYKRATLLLSDAERLARILNAEGRPVQVIFAGKAHPRDDGGKELIRQIFQTVRKPEFRRRIVLLEDYDAVVARYLLGGVDVWLNNPRRPLEASGTSGMKAVFNGAINLSVLDGWWDEAYTPRAGWAIGTRREYEDLAYQDRLESSAIYDLLEKEVVPLFYHRGNDGLPHAWIDLMRSALSELCPVFNTNRMVNEYLASSYLPARDRRARLQAEQFWRARVLSQWRARVGKAWKDIRVTSVEADLPAEPTVGSSFEVRAWVDTGSLSPKDVVVELYLGRVNSDQRITNGEIVIMGPQGTASDLGQLYVAQAPCRRSGTQGLTVRVMPFNEDQAHPHDMALITWAE